MKKGLLIGCSSVFALFLFMGACAMMVVSTETDSTAKTTEKEEKAEKLPAKEEAKKSKPEEPTWNDGTFLVGEDIEPGIYKSDGNSTYYARLKDLSGSLDAIIANGNASGPVYVEIKESDEAFQSKGGASWRKIDLNKYKGEVQEEYTDGIYLVGKDIEPGTYQVDGGYWARLKNVSGELNAVISNENVSGTGYVTIAESDFAIEISGGTLVKK